MKRRQLIMTALGCLIALVAYAQETVMMNTGNIVSPEINANGTVTFRLLSPQAKDVRLLASFLQDAERRQRTMVVYIGEVNAGASHLYICR